MSRKENVNKQKRWALKLDVNNLSIKLSIKVLML